tara:strand:+ start:389 stop:631 length:243 start_codon:yes stop_codon:yes gene_type:complete
MKKLLLISALFAVPVAAEAQVYVDGYTRSNGTFVQGHYRTSPNSTVTDNYSYSPSFGGSGSSMSWDSNGMYIPNNSGLNY